jgi:hypothetical protein
MLPAGDRPAEGGEGSHRGGGDWMMLQLTREEWERENRECGC